MRSGQKCLVFCLPALGKAGVRPAPAPTPTSGPRTPVFTQPGATFLLTSFCEHAGVHACVHVCVHVCAPAHSSWSSPITQRSLATWPSLQWGTAPAVPAHSGRPCSRGALRKAGSPEHPEAAAPWQEAAGSPEWLLGLSRVTGPPVFSPGRAGLRQLPRVYCGPGSRAWPPKPRRPVRRSQVGASGSVLGSGLGSRSWALLGTGQSRADAGRLDPHAQSFCFKFLVHVGELQVQENQVFREISELIPDDQQLIFSLKRLSKP